MSDASKVVVTPTIGEHGTSMMICGLAEGSRVTISVPGAKEECHYFVGKQHQVHTFGFDEAGPVKIGQCDCCAASEAASEMDA